jgi:hypothetical protein
MSDNLDRRYAEQMRRSRERHVEIMEWLDQATNVKSALVSTRAI